MVTVLPHNPSLGELMGQAAGKGLQQGMQGSMQQMQQSALQQKQGMALSQALGMSPQQGMLISSLPPELQKEIIQQSLSRQLLAKAGEGDGGEGFGAGQQPDYGYGPRTSGESKGQGYLGPIKTSDNKVMTELSVGVNLDGKEIEIPSIVPTLNKSEIEHLRSGGKPTPAIMKKAVEHAKMRLSQGKSPFAQAGEQQPLGEQPAQPQADKLQAQADKLRKLGFAADAGGNPALAKSFESKAKSLEKKIGELKKTEQHEEEFQHKSWKEIKKDRVDIINSKNASARGLEAAKRMEILNEKDDLINPFMIKIFQGLGIDDISALMTADSQEMQKLTGVFLEKMKSLFGAQMSAQEVQIFLKTIPSLMQSKEGRRRIISQFKDVFESGIERYNTMRDIEKEYKGKAAPFDFLEQVEDLTAERIAKKKEEKVTAAKAAAEAKLKPLTPEAAFEFRRKAKGNIETAKKLARQAGYREE